MTIKMPTVSFSSSQHTGPCTKVKTPTTQLWCHGTIFWPFRLAIYHHPVSTQYSATTRSTWDINGQYQIQTLDSESIDSFKEREVAHWSKLVSSKHLSRAIHYFSGEKLEKRRLSPITRLAAATCDQPYRNTEGKKTKENKTIVSAGAECLREVKKRLPL